MLPFTDKCSASLLLEGAPSFPIAIGGVSQPKSSLGDIGVNSQDAFGLYIGNRLIIGVVSDGCGSGAAITQDQARCSSNELGARLLVQATIHRCLKILSAPQGLLSPRQPLDKTFLHTLTKGLLKSLATTVKTFCSKDEAMRERFICDNLMATILGVVVAEDRFIVFGCGDGYIGVNDEIHSLKDQEGKYLANNLLLTLCPRTHKDPRLTSQLDSLATSTTEDLRAVVLATDGFAPVHSADASFFQNILNEPPPSTQVNAGHDRLLRELRRRLLTGPAKAVEFRDDATLIAVRRTQTPAQHD